MSVRIQVHQSHMIQAIHFLNLESQIDEKIIQIAKRMLVILGLSFALFMAALVGLALPAYAAVFSICLLCSGGLLAIIAAVEEVRHRIFNREGKVLNLLGSMAIDWIERGVHLEKAIDNYLEKIVPFAKDLRLFLLECPPISDTLKSSARQFYSSARELRESKKWGIPH